MGHRRRFMSAFCKAAADSWVHKGDRSSGPGRGAKVEQVDSTSTSSVTILMTCLTLYLAPAQCRLARRILTSSYVTRLPHEA